MDEPKQQISCTYFNGESQCPKAARKLVNGHATCAEHARQFMVTGGDNDVVDLDRNSSEVPRKSAAR